MSSIINTVNGTPEAAPTNDINPETAVTPENTADVTPDAGVTTERDLSWLPEQYHADETFGSMNTFEDLVNEFKNAKDIKSMSEFKGWENIRENHPELLEKLGIPTEVEGYKLELEGANEELLAVVQKTAYEIGAPKGMVEAIATKFFEAEKALVAKEEEVLVKELESKEEALKQAWGSEYQTNNNLIKQAIDELSPDGHLTEFFRDNPEQLVDPRMANFLKDVAKALGDPVSPAGGSERRIISTVAQAEARKQYILNDATLKEDYKNGGAAYDEVIRLNEIIAKKK